MGIVITKAGWHTLVMDQGRKFTRHLGIPSSGVLDLFQYWWANGLIGHFDFSHPGPPVLEIGSGPVQIEFENDHNFALTGSIGDYFLDGERISSHCTHFARKHQRLRIDSIGRHGTVYLAIGGNWLVDMAYGSASMDLLSPFPGTSGNLLKNNTHIEIIPNDNEIIQFKSSPDYVQHSYRSSHQVLRLTAGPELNLIDHNKNTLLQDDFTITPASNRMAYRLETNITPAFRKPSMISSIVMPGTIQWPVGGQPILLLPNCQTTGGYPRIGKVIDADMWQLAYMGSGDKIRFKWHSRSQALFVRQYQSGQFTRIWNQTFPHPIKNHWLLY